jgi:hypothetical protein
MEDVMEDVTSGELPGVGKTDGVGLTDTAAEVEGSTGARDAETEPTAGEADAGADVGDAVLLDAGDLLAAGAVEAVAEEELENAEEFAPVELKLATSKEEPPKLLFWQPRGSTSVGPGDPRQFGRPNFVAFAYCPGTVLMYAEALPTFVHVGAILPKP